MENIFTRSFRTKGLLSKYSMVLRMGAGPRINGILECDFLELVHGSLAFL